MVASGGYQEVWYHEDTHSNAKRTPPTGARKAAAIPAPAPQVTRSRRSLSFLKYLNHLQVSLYFRDPPCPSMDAMQELVCTNGPALPTWRDEDTAAMEPTTCKFIKVRTSSSRHHYTCNGFSFFCIIQMIGKCFRIDIQKWADQIRYLWIVLIWYKKKKKKRRKLIVQSVLPIRYAPQMSGVKAVQHSKKKEAKFIYFAPIIDWIVHRTIENFSQSRRIPKSSPSHTTSLMRKFEEHQHRSGMPSLLEFQIQLP